MSKYLLGIALCFAAMPLLAQDAPVPDPCDGTLKGRVVKENGEYFHAQSIEVKIIYSFNSTTYGGRKDSLVTYTDKDGRFTFCMKVPLELQRFVRGNDKYKEITLKVKWGGYVEYVRTFNNTIGFSYDFGNIVLKREADFDTPAPTDLIEQDVLNRTGQQTVGLALHQIAPGFNSTVQPISDGSAHFDPTDFHNLGASRTLFLINGKRKNLASYIQTNDVPGKGEVGVDIRSIPLAAIERVKIERQEATTIYGSDAIGGVIDFQLKGLHPGFSASAFSGINSDRLDGFTYGMDMTKGIRLGGEGGFLTVTYSYQSQDESNRANSPGYDLSQTTVTPIREKWIARNPSLGMRIGKPQMLTNAVVFNSSVPLNTDSETHLYSFGNATYRSTKSYANYRTPYWVTNDYRLFSTSDSTYQGFQPTFESDVRDHFLVFGVSGVAGKGSIEYDLSQTLASHDIDFAVDSSFNPTLKENSPISFKVGGYNLSTNNTRFTLDWIPSDKIYLLKYFRFRLGSDFRSEKYNIKAGEESAYTGQGSISYPGTQPSDALSANRNNFGAFGQAIGTFKRFTGEFSYRYEKYYKFQSDNAVRGSMLVRLADNDELKWVLRSSLSTGFRAPSLQQLYYNRIQTVTTGQIVGDRGTFNTFSPVFRQLGIEPLRSEGSNTFSIGTSLNFKISDETRVSAAIDFYTTRLTDRIVLSSSIDSARIPDAANPVRKILSSNQINSLNFFLNAVDTRTSGLDFVLKGTHYFSNQQNEGIEMSLTSNLRVQDTITRKATASSIVESTKIDIFDRKEQSRLISARPRNKGSVTLRYFNEQKFSATLNAAHFGDVTWLHPTNPANDQTFSGKWLLNAALEYHCLRIRDEEGNRGRPVLALSFTIANIFNQYPDPLDPKGDNSTNLGGRFHYYREVNQFGYEGRTFLLRTAFSL